MKVEKDTIHIKSLIDANQRMPGFPGLADLIVEHPEAIGELVEIATSEDEYPYPQYASWLLLHISRKDYTLVETYYNGIIDCILTTSNMSVKRNLLGVSLCLPIKEHEEGRFFDHLLSIIEDNDSKPGMVCYTTRKLEQFAKLYPELQNEIDILLNLRIEKRLF